MRLANLRPVPLPLPPRIAAPSIWPALQGWLVLTVLPQPIRDPGAGHGAVLRPLLSVKEEHGIVYSLFLSLEWVRRASISLSAKRSPSLTSRSYMTSLSSGPGYSCALRRSSQKTCMSRDLFRPISKLTTSLRRPSLGWTAIYGSPIYRLGESSSSRPESSCSPGAGREGGS